jgi:hypothetical protein
MKRIFCFVFLFIFMLSIVSSASIGAKDSYDLGETFIAEVEGNFLETILVSDIVFYRRHLSTSFENVEIESFGERTFIYFDVPLEKVADEYSIIITDVLHKKGVEETREDVFANFNISSEIVQFSVSPGVVYAEGDYEIEIVNYQENEIEIEINSGEMVSESLVVEEQGFFESLFGSEEANETVVSGTTYFDEGSFIVKEGEVVTKLFSPEKEGFDYLILSSGNQSYEIPIYFEGVLIEEEEIVGGENETFIEENVTAENETFIEDNDTLKEIEQSVPTCEEKNGTVCNKTQECSGEEVTARKNHCCLDVCENVEEASWGKMIGWIIIIALGFFVAWFFKKKYRKPAKKIDLVKVSKGKK